MKPHCLPLLVTLLWQGQPSHAATNDCDPARLAYHLKNSLGAYERIGRKSPKWDADAKKCLATFAQIQAVTNNTAGALLQGLRTNLAQVVATGCDDPFIRYLHFRLNDPYPGPDTTGTYPYSNALVALQNSAYPNLRKAYATLWARDSTLKGPAGTNAGVAFTKAAASFLASALEDESLPLADADQACERLMVRNYWLPERTRWECYQVLEPALTNRWKGSSFALLAKGRAYLAYAWGARGSGFAHTVSAEGWKGMEERLDIADRALEEAWKLNPNDVRICLEMVRLELLQGKGRDHLELWFQRGMKLDPANYNLCYEKLQYLLPRWYGSEEEMFAFGRECAANTNLAYDARLTLAEAHLLLARYIPDKEKRQAYWTKPEVWPDIQSTFEQFFRSFPDAVGYRHNYALYAARCRQWPEFLKQVRLFPSTNYAYFGGEAEFRRLLQTAQNSAKKP